MVNAYLLTYGGLLLLGGRLGDLLGHRRVFAAAIGVFTLASLACGLAQGQAMLLAARATQGIGGAVASAAALSLVVSLFPEPGARARAMGVYGMASAGGSSIGVLLGGILTGLLSWHLGYSPLRTGLAFLPMNLIMSALSAGVAARLVDRLGVRPPLVTGLLLAAAGLALMGRAPSVGTS